MRDSTAADGAPTRTSPERSGQRCRRLIGCARSVASEDGIGRCEPLREAQPSARPGHVGDGRQSCYPAFVNAPPALSSRSADLRQLSEMPGIGVQHPPELVSGLLRNRCPTRSGTRTRYVNVSRTPSAGRSQAARRYPAGGSEMPGPVVAAAADGAGARDGGSRGGGRAQPSLSVRVRAAARHRARDAERAGRDRAGGRQRRRRASRCRLRRADATPSGWGVSHVKSASAKRKLCAASSPRRCRNHP